MDTPLNGQQLQAIQKQAQDALQVAIEALQLRKWAVEQAFAVIGSLNSVKADGVVKINDPIALTEWIYGFVSKAAVVRVDITGAGK
jgi:hypothetical protein